MNKFRLLKADEIECRIAQVKADGISLLLYKTARTDANLLDETVGEFGWQNDFKLIDGVLYGGIGIKENLVVNDSPWIWKWDAGTESYTEAEKGRASDSFKRAGFKWGIGRELYSAPFIWITKDKCNIKQDDKGVWKCFDKFEVAYIEYDSNSDISVLSIINSKSRVEVYKWEAKNKPTEIFSGEDKITATKLKAITKTLKDEGLPILFVCEQWGIKSLSEMTEEQFAYTSTNIQGLKAKYKERGEKNE